MTYFQYGQAELDYLRARDPILGAQIERSGMLQREIMPDLFKALVRAIVAQQISTKAVRTVFARVEDDLGSITPEQILTRSVEEIQAYGMTFRKAGYIRSAAERILSGEIPLDQLQHYNDEELEKTLVQLDGVGPWTAEMLMIFSLQRPNILSYGDLAIIRGMKRLYGYEQVSRQVFREHKAVYSPYASVASLYLWEAASDEPAEDAGGLG